jgi:hypothetical protein
MTAYRQQGLRNTAARKARIAKVNARLEAMRVPAEDRTTCWNCKDATTVYDISHDGLCFECDSKRNAEA